MIKIFLKSNFLGIFFYDLYTQTIYVNFDDTTFYGNQL